MNNPSISVIVPIYQSEATLRRCLDSIQSQTFTDIEVLLVDDGSTDKSADICEEYVQKDNRFHLFRKPHSGVSDTRQMGLDNASGEYVIHCDSDDWMELNMLYFLNKKARQSNADLIICDYVGEYEDYNIIYHDYISNCSDSSLINAISYYLWNKLIKRNFLIENNITFPSGLEMAEDMHVILMAIYKNAKICYLPIALYHYNHSYSRTSITNQPTKSMLQSNIKEINDLENILDTRFKQKLKSNKVQVIFNAYKNNLFSKKEIYNLFPEVHSSILFYAIKNRKLGELVKILFF